MAILSGHTLGILDGGQLARMGAMAARAMGYKVAVLDPDPRCCAGPVADVVLTAALDDVAAATTFAHQVAVATYDIEKIGAEVTRPVSERVPLRPGRDVVRRVADRATQKTWLRERGFPLGPFACIDRADDIGAALSAWKQPGRLKTRQGGTMGAAKPAVWTQLTGRPHGSV